LGRIPNLTEYNETLSRTYRGAFSIGGPITDSWNFAADIVGMAVACRGAAWPRPEEMRR